MSIRNLIVSISQKKNELKLQKAQAQRLEKDIKHLTQLSESSLKVCFFCGNDIAIAAKICAICKKILPDSAEVVFEMNRKIVEYHWDLKGREER